MSGADPSAEPAAPLWAFVPLAEHRVPSLPVGSAAMQAWEAVKKALRRTDDEDAPAREEEALRALSDVRLAHLVRPIDWDRVSRALDDATTPSTLTVLVGAPHGGHAAIVEAWAARHRARLIAPPSPAQVLRDDRHWHPPWQPDAGPWALPRLEHCFLRHADGLAAVRRLLEDLASGRAGAGLVGCDSWAWAYLQRVWPLPQARVLTLQALDAHGLQRLFVDLAPPPRLRGLSFRNARSGAETLRVPARDEAPAEDLVVLAAHSRGHAAIARLYWRHRLRTEPDADLADRDAGADEPGEPGDAAADTGGEPPDAAQDGRDGPAAADAQVVWVTAAFGEPALPAEAGEDVALLLHALLLHGGLPEAVLAEVLPMPAQHVLALLWRLHRQRVVEQHDGRWTVAPLAYAVVRASLRGRDYLVDDL